MSEALGAGGPPPSLVQVEAAVNQSLSPTMLTVGTVICRDDVYIDADVEGRLLNVLEVGERVNKGEVIAKIESTRYQIAIDEIKAEIMPVQTMVEFYTKEAERLNKLAENNNTAKSQLDETIANRDQSLAQIKLIQARLVMANDDLSRTVITAPFDGVISERIKQTGERVSSDEDIVRLMNTKYLEIQTYIQLHSLYNIEVGDTLRINQDQDSFNATVKSLIPVGDNQSRLYEMRLITEERQLTAGMSLKVAVPTAKEQTVLVVPRDALVIRQAGTVIYKIDENNVAQIVPVKIGIANTTHIQVMGEVKEGDRIVTRGNERLRPGATVQVING